METAAVDWDALRRLAERGGHPAERIAALRKRLDPQRPRPGAPYTLLAGRPDGGIELLLARRFSPDLAEALVKAEDRPLVLGPDPDPLCPRVGGWKSRTLAPPPWGSGHEAPGHWIAVRIPVPPEVDLVAQLATLGYIEQLVIVTRLGQPLHQIEREFAKTFAGLCCTVKVLFVALPGEEASAGDVAELHSFAQVQIRDQGLPAGRYLGAGVWRSKPDPADVNFLADPLPFLEVDRDRARSQRDALFRAALRDTLKAIEAAAARGAEPQLVAPPIPAEEVDRMARELETYLGDLGRQLRRGLESNLSHSDDSLRMAARNQIRGWGAGVTIEGFWLKHLEKLRPGFQEGFFAAFEETIDVLSYEPPAGGRRVEADPDAEQAETDISPPPSDGPLPTGMQAIAVREAKRLGIALIGAIGMYALVTLAIAELPGLLRGGPRPPTTGGGWLESLGGGVAFVVGLVLTYAVAGPWFRDTGPVRRRGHGSSAPPPVGRLLGWERVQAHLTRWFAERMRQPIRTIGEECRELARVWTGEESAA